MRCIYGLHCEAGLEDALEADRPCMWVAMLHGAFLLALLWGEFPLDVDVNLASLRARRVYIFRGPKSSSNRPSIHHATKSRFPR